MANNKVQLADGTVLMDLTEDTVTPESMLLNTKAHDRSGAQITGMLITTELPFMITKQPEIIPLAAAGSVTFSVEVAGGSGEYTYQWQLLMEGLDWINATGATDASFTVSLSGETNCLYRCVISDGVTTLYSDPGYVYNTASASDMLRFAVNDGNYGVCSTAEDVQIKTVSIPGLLVRTGVTIHVRFLHANTASQPMLRVNNGSQKNIVLYNNIAAGTTNQTNGWYAGAVVALTYNGTYWVRDQGYNTNTTYSGMSASEIEAGTSTTNRLISPANLKTAIQTWESKQGSIAAFDVVEVTS